MSRIGTEPVTIPSGVTLEIKDGNIVARGSNGELTTKITPLSTVKIEDSTVTVTRTNDEKKARAQHGLMRSLIQNMVTGVSEGFSKTLEVEGVGFKVSVSGQTLKLALGFSHDVEYVVHKDVKVEVDGMQIKISGPDKQLVGQVAAEIRKLKKPEPYKGKGIRYTDEYIVRKAGKAAATGEAA